MKELKEIAMMFAIILVGILVLFCILNHELYNT